MHKLRILLLFITLAILAACSSAVPDPDLRYSQIRPMEFDGELLMPGGELLEDKYFRDFFRKTDYLLLGESHTNMTDHISQAAILEKLAKRRLKPVLGVEFVDVDSQPILDRFNRGELSTDQLEEALNWEHTVGFSFGLYRPIFETAQKHKIPVYALNIPRRLVREARLNGIERIQEKDKKYLPGWFIPASEEQRAHLRSFFDDHLDRMQGGMPAQDALTAMSMAKNSSLAMPQTPPQAPRQAGGPAQAGKTPDDGTRPQLLPSPEEQARLAAKNKSIEGFITAQALWDCAMAERAVRVHQTSKRPVVIIVGQGHVEYGWGIAMRLRAYDENARIVSVLPWRLPLESVFMQKQRSPLLDSVLPPVFPPPELADLYYYSPTSPVGLAPQGLVVGTNPSSRRPQLLVLSVFPKSAADEAGFLAGDIILQVDRRAVTSGEDLFSVLAQAAAYGAKHMVTVQRGNEKIDLPLPAWAKL